MWGVNRRVGEAKMADAEARIRSADKEDLEDLLEVLNVTNKTFYEAIVPADTFREPYLTAEDLAEESEHKVFKERKFIP